MFYGIFDNAKEDQSAGTCLCSKLDEKDRPAYFEFLSVPHLLEQFHSGQTHVFHKYWTQSARFEPMLAEQHIVMYADEENGDVLAITYVLDLTQADKEA